MQFDLRNSLHSHERNAPLAGVAVEKLSPRRFSLRIILERLLRLAKPFRWWVVASALLSFATIGSNVGLTAVSAYLIAKAAVAMDVTQLSLAIAGVRFFAFARAAFRYGERYLTHLTAFRILTELRVWFYRSLEPLAPARLLQTHSGDLFTRIGADIETLENFYVRVVIPPFTALLVTAGMCAMLGIFTPTLAFIFVLYMLLTGVALPGLTQWMSRQAASEQIEKRNALNMLLVDSIQGMAELMGFGQADRQRNALLAQSAQFHRAQERLAMSRAAANGLSALFTGLVSFFILLFAAAMVNEGALDGVYLALLPLSAIAASEAVQPLSHAVQALETSRAAAERVFDLIDASPNILDPIQPLPPPQGHTLSVRNLYFHYPSSAVTAEPPVFNGLSFELHRGERLAITGASGAGKSTLAALLLRFWEADSGSILLDGQDIRAYAADDVRTCIAIAPQAPYFFHATIRDNLLVANPEAGEEELIEACRHAQVHEFIAGLPQGYDTLVGEHGLHLSGGERQRLAIARMLLKNAPIVILDEATTYLDADTAARVWKALDVALADRIVLILDHNELALSHADRVLRLMEGRLVDSGASGRRGCTSVA
ncbi:thiol reductant ABC exporter subunit CydC [Caldilinea sp.]|uniref:thiol reductant ABC exporter subunit CydC n=1 Tax=Caldilinea sp. TaxID=2293560 RepID=UPI0021DC1340|nr:thiol reductant ABC exporter subunit CydC [Caldilinea sp.]GIV67783.1 MAG: thiol reductant ABC exporter subunit CydC [Caldilinea sp.]